MSVVRMEIRLISVGRVREKFYRQGVEEYIKRLRPYIKVTLLDGLDYRISPRAREAELAEARHKEAAKVLSIIKSGEVLIVLDQKGQRPTSEELAVLLERCRQEGKNRLNLVIGGPTGVSARLKDRADYLLSLSQLTFPHQLAVLIAVEQLYRAFTILNYHPYHK